MIARATMPIASPPRPRRSLAAAALAVSGGGGAALHILAVAVASVLTPGAYPLSHAISELGMAGRPHATLTNFGGMVAPGVLIAASAIAATKLAGGGVPPAGAATLLAAGASLVVAGLVPFPAPLHLAAALAAATLCALALAWLAPWASRRLGSRAWRATGALCALLLAVDAVAWVLAEGLGRPLHGWMGLEQRAASFAAFGWWGLCALALARREARTTG